MDHILPIEDNHLLLYTLRDQLKQENVEILSLTQHSKTVVDDRPWITISDGRLKKPNVHNIKIL